MTLVSCRAIKNNSQLVGVVYPMMWDVPDFPWFSWTIYFLYVTLLHYVFHESLVVVIVARIVMKLLLELS